MIENFEKLDFTGRNFDTTYIPVGGDQLSRVNFEEAKALRIGSHTRDEELGQFSPVIIELFHILQDFVEVTSIQIL